MIITQIDKKIVRNYCFFINFDILTKKNLKKLKLSELKNLKLSEKDRSLRTLFTLIDLYFS